MAASAPFQFLPLGAIIQTFQVGRTNVVQGFPTAELYEKFNSPYFGETIGRTANRIKGAKIEFLNGKSYSLAANDGPNNLHGGVKGWGKRVWNGPLQTGNKEIPGLKGEKFAGETSVKFTLRSEDGDEGFPGDVDATVTYTTGTQVAPDGKKVHILAIEYQAELVGSADETVINMTNHS
jgi:aldose 1-epimerase